MMSNMATWDRVIRVVLGLVLVAWALGWIGTANNWGWIGLILIATGLVSFCPLYRMIGFKTNKSA